MQTKQTKSNNASTTTKTAETAQKAAIKAKDAARVPVWANANSSSINLQTKLTVNQPGDIYEQEADRVAEQVMRMPTSPAIIQRKCACGGTAGPTGECEECAKKRVALQRKSIQSVSGTTAPAIVNSVLSSSGTPLDASTRSFMEPRFGHDFGNVRIHTDQHAVESARAVSALAYTVGQNIVFGAGTYAPGTYAGQELLAHELTHTVQQQNGSSGGMQRKIKVEDAGVSLPGTPPKKNWEEIRDDITALCSSFLVDSSGAVTPTGGSCSTASGSTACKCLCDLNNSSNPEPWKIKIDETGWPHTDPPNRRVFIHSSRSAMSFGAWGAGPTAAGHRIADDPPRVLAHEICGHAQPAEHGTNTGSAPGPIRTNHDLTVGIENKITRERGGSPSDDRALASGPHRGESFARVTISGFPKGSADVSSLSPDMRARIATIRSFLTNPQVKVDVIGHTDHTGTSAINARLSLDRAKSVLAALGIAATPARFRDVEGRSDRECPPIPTGDNTMCHKVDIFLFIYEAASETSP